MKWPWQRRVRSDRLVVGCGEDRFVYLQADGTRLRRCGVEERGGDSPQAFARRVRALGLPAQEVIAVLPLAQCQVLQIEAPAVPAEELKAAARWRIKDLVDTRLDELTLDVLVVGDGRPRASRQLFVAAANSAAVRDTGDWARSAGLPLSVIDIRETAQRNLQTALAGRAGRLPRASAALVRQGDQCLLTISAAGELFYTRRLDWDADALSAARATAAPDAGRSSQAPVASLEMMDIVDYGAEPESGDAGDAGEAPRFVIELQRSLDVWERTWPDLPLSGIVVHAAGQSQALAELLERSLGLAVEPLDATALFPELAEHAPALREAVLPLLGTLLRDGAASA